MGTGGGRRQRVVGDRGTAMSARPRQAEVLRAAPRDDGGMEVTVRLRRGGWRRLLGGSGARERTYGLDAYGRHVFEACDGQHSVGAIVRRFARAHKVSHAEAELSVTTFLRTLMTRGLVVMEVDPPKKKARH